MHTPGRITDVGRDFNPKEFAARVKSSGADAICFFARCAYGWSYYSTEVGTPHPHLTRDLFGDGLKNQGQYGWKLGYMLLRGTEAEAFWRDGDDFRPPLPVPGKPARVAANGAQTLAPLTAPGESFQLGALPPGETLSTPAIAVNGFGKGTVIFCALPLSADIWKRGNPGAKYVLQKMVRRVVRNLTAERLGPASVQMFRSEKDGSTLLHLVSYQPGRRTSRPPTASRIRGPRAGPACRGTASTR
jgi:hypothetical protein